VTGSISSSSFVRFLLAGWVGGFRRGGKKARTGPGMGVFFFLSFLTTFFFAFFLIFIFIFFFVTETFERDYSLHYYIATYILHCILYCRRGADERSKRVSFFVLGFLVSWFRFFFFALLRGMVKWGWTGKGTGEGDLLVERGGDSSCVYF
jgi:hypothetical protein